MIPQEPLYPEQPSTQEESTFHPTNQQMKTCSFCKLDLPFDKFSTNKDYSDGLNNRCKKCVLARRDELHALKGFPVVRITEKACERCLIIKPVSEFHKNKYNPDGFKKVCRTCLAIESSERYRANPVQPDSTKKKARDWRDKNKKQIREARIDRDLTYYGANRKWYKQKLAEQNGRCEICGMPDMYENRRRLSIDHCHDCCPTGRGCDRCRRGLLCTKCNFRLSVLENAEWKPKAIAYLKKYRLKDASGNAQPSLFDGL